MVLRGSTDRLLDDLERAVDDGVNTFKVRFLDLWVPDVHICLKAGAMAATAAGRVVTRCSE